MKTEDPILRVLIAAADPDFRARVSRLLSKTPQHRFTVNQAETLAAALDCVRHAPFDALLLDPGLPDAPGWPSFAQLFATAPDLPILLLTGADGEELGARAVREGAQDHLLKEDLSSRQLAHAILNSIERRETRTALRLARDKLEQGVLERTADLSDTNDQLREAIHKLETHERARAEFIENVSHELRTPLASMSYATANLLRGIAGPLPDRVKTYLALFRDECQRMLETVTGILDMNRIDAGTVLLHRMRLPFCRFVRRTIEELRPRANAKSIELIITGDDVPAFVNADPLRIGRVVSSVLKNAIALTPEGGRIEVAMRPILDHTWMELSVIDSGASVEPGDLPRLTERYFRLGEFVNGTGLELALVRELLELHGGKLELKSPPPGREHGTQVSIRLPRTEPPVILAVDDSSTVRTLIARQLAMSGYDVQTCANAEQAMAVVKTCPPDMLIIDSVMPGMDGVEMIKAVKADHALRHIPIIMLTGAELDRPKREVLEGFAIPVLGKPWNQGELINSLEDAVYGKRYQEG